MSALDDVIAANGRFASTFTAGDLPAPPTHHLAMLMCMDARITPLSAFGLKIGDAHILRNGGGRVTDDVLRSLLVSSHMLGVREIAVIHHTLCGMGTATDEEFAQAVTEGSGHSPGDLEFHAFTDIEQSLKEDVDRLTTCGLFPPGTDVRGFEYDVKTGRLRQVV